MIWTIAQNDGRRRLRAPGGTIILLLVPLVMCGLIGAIFSPGSSMLPKVPLIIADEDQGIAAHFIGQAFAAPQSRGMFTIKTADRRSGLVAVAAGRASALLIIPAGFSRSLLQGQATALELVKNPAEQFLPVIAEDFVRTLTVGLSALVLVFFDEIQAEAADLGQGGDLLTPARLASFLQRGRTKVDAVRRLVSPLLISIEKQVVVEKKNDRQLSVFATIFPGMAVLFLFFIVQSAMQDLLREKETGTLRRIQFSPLPETTYILGKIVGAGLIGFCAYWLMTLAATLIFRLPLGHLAGHLLLSLAVVFFAAAFFALVFSLVRSRQQAAALTTPAILVFGVLGGSMIPIDQLGRGFAALAHFSPNYWFITGCHKVFAGRFPLAALLILALLGVICFTASYFLLQKRLELA